MTTYKFIKHASIFDPELIMYSLETDYVFKLIDDVKFIEVTPDFKRVQMVRADSLKPIGVVHREY